MNPTSLARSPPRGSLDRDSQWYSPPPPACHADRMLCPTAAFLVLSATSPWSGTGNNEETYKGLADAASFSTPPLDFLVSSDDILPLCRVVRSFSCARTRSSCKRGSASCKSGMGIVSRILDGISNGTASPRSIWRARWLLAESFFWPSLMSHPSDVTRVAYRPNVRVLSPAPASRSGRASTP
ncbi:hypothetical protein OG21DRAFT_964660 [Imleria badia]|nr:hypothetical protein OG21DRAFT_964660 [Imleria badia]